MKNLKLLDLSGNKFGDRTLTALSIALARGAAPMITHLQLGHNAISDGGVKAFSAALVGFEGFENLRAATFRETETVSCAVPRLERLMLTHNAIGPRGAEHLAQAAESGAFKVLTCLALSSNPIGDLGFAAIAKVTA